MPGSRKVYTLLFDAVPICSGNLGNVYFAFDAVSDVLKNLGILDKHILSVALILKGGS